ncbi:response regulator [Iningainema tapete]|uniref:Protein PatA n=1 Tax=Iningainema tapete BLCC-T55 TaxID=2748662 RepID=A0A8J6XE37_9CYAN|nr:response regulator [Iningainema tapete]MBD2770802.1 response regulator [Iningainema tapete BLCC-T55]
MNHPELIVLNQLLSELKQCTQLQYSGKLDIESAKGHKWTLYYRLGRIVWATGGTHPLRRWRRQMAQHCPSINADKIRLSKENLSIDYWDYRLLAILHQEQNIQREQIKAIVENTITEVLFDINQQANFTNISCERNQQVILEAPISFTSTDMSVKLVEDSWAAWAQAGLAKISPNLAPMLQKPEQLQQHVSAGVYKNFLSLMNGKYTLRDLAIKMKQSVLQIARSLQPYVLKEMIELVEVPDLPLCNTNVKNNSVTKPTLETGPLIACVDDSLQVCQMLEQILNSNGMRLIKIQDAVQALPILIQHKPDLIFLDLIMPIANGYEICSQVRRVSALANIPVIILTGNEGLIDRVRAKVVGSTDFINKPVTADKVMGVVRKYLQHPSSVKSGSKQNLSYGHS